MSTASPSRPARPPPPSAAARRRSTDVEGCGSGSRDGVVPSYATSDILDGFANSKSGDGVPDAPVIGKKTTWDELFGGSSSTDSTAIQRTPAATTGTSEADRADSWLDSMPGFTSNHHSDHTASNLFDSSTMFDDAFLDGIVGMSRGTAQQADDVWNSSTTGQDAWSSCAADTSYSRSPFDDVAAFPETTTTLTTTRTAGDERARPRPRPQAAAVTAAAVNVDNPFSVTLQAATAAARSAIEGSDYEYDDDEDDDNVGGSVFFSGAVASNNPFAGTEDVDVDYLAPAAATTEFNPFATITDDDQEVFDPFQTIHDDDALNVPFSSEDRASDDDATSPSRFNPFNKEPQLSDKLTELHPKPRSEDVLSPKSKSETSSFDEPEPDNLEPLEPFLPHWEQSGGWNLLLRQPFRKQLTANRFWKPAFVRVATKSTSAGDLPAVRVFADDQSTECLHEVVLQPSYNLCEMGLQQLDQYGKCHTVKIQQVSYKESIGVRGDRIAPTIGDLARVRDFRGLKDLIHKPKTTMILDHAPHAVEILKLGGLNYAEFKNFVHTVEDLFFSLTASRANKYASYSKDELNIDVQDEYCAEIDRDGHITRHKARVRLFCLAFLSGTPTLDVGVNDRRRRGREVVSRHDIIPIKTEDWIRIEDWRLHGLVDVDEFDRSKVLRFVPLDACRFELMRFRVRPRPNVELPLQVRVQMSVVDRHIEIRAEVVVTGYYSSSRRAAQTPCEDIQIRFPLPEPWIYLFRVERRFKYGSVHSATRKPGRIKGLERLSQLAQGILPPSLIEVSAGLAKYEHVFKAIVWRIDQLPERNEGAYKTHMLSLNVDLGPHDAIPETLDKFVNVEFTMNNSTVSHAQVRSVSVSGSPADEPPDRWVRHSARYEYTVEIEFTDRVRCKPDAGIAAYDGDDAAEMALGGEPPRRSSRATSTERSAAGGLGRPGDRSASAPPITADDSSDESPPTDDSD